MQYLSPPTATMATVAGVSGVAGKPINMHSKPQYIKRNTRICMHGYWSSTLNRTEGKEGWKHTGKSVGHGSSSPEQPRSRRKSSNTRERRRLPGATIATEDRWWLDDTEDRRRSCGTSEVGRSKGRRIVAVPVGLPPAGRRSNRRRPTVAVATDGMAGGAAPVGSWAAAWRKRRTAALGLSRCDGSRRRKRERERRDSLS